MVKHIVQFKLLPDLEASEKQMVMERFKSKILSLPQKLSIIRSIEIGFNINEDEHWDICLVATFDTLANVRTYSVFPDHKEAASEIKPYVEMRSCVDFEY